MPNFCVIIMLFSSCWAECEPQVDGFPGCFFKKFGVINYGSREKASAAAAIEYKKQAANRRPSIKERTYFAVAEGKAKVTGIFFKR